MLQKRRLDYAMSYGSYSFECRKGKGPLASTKIVVLKTANADEDEQEDESEEYNSVPIVNGEKEELWQ